MRVPCLRGGLHVLLPWGGVGLGDLGPHPASGSGAGVDVDRVAWGSRVGHAGGLSRVVAASLRVALEISLLNPASGNRGGEHGRYRLVRAGRTSTGRQTQTVRRPCPQSPGTARRRARSTTGPADCSPGPRCAESRWAAATGVVLEVLGAR
jgi:hypothetical protein